MTFEEKASDYEYAAAALRSMKSKPAARSLAIVAIFLAVCWAQIFFFQSNLDLHQRIAKYECCQSHGIGQEEKESEQGEAHAQENWVA